MAALQHTDQTPHLFVSKTMAKILDVQRLTLRVGHQSLEHRVNNDCACIRWDVIVKL